MFERYRIVALWLVYTVAVLDLVFVALVLCFLTPLGQPWNAFLGAAAGGAFTVYGMWTKDLRV